MNGKKKNNLRVLAIDFARLHHVGNLVHVPTKKSDELRGQQATNSSEITN
jgi:hypothetical protein